MVHKFKTIHKKSVSRRKHASRKKHITHKKRVSRKHSKTNFKLYGGAFSTLTNAATKAVSYLNPMAYLKQENTQPQPPPEVPVKPKIKSSYPLNDLRSAQDMKKEVYDLASNKFVEGSRTYFHNNIFTPQKPLTDSLYPFNNIVTITQEPNTVYDPKSKYFYRDNTPLTDFDPPPSNNRIPRGEKFEYNFFETIAKSDKNPKPRPKPLPNPSYSYYNPLNWVRSPPSEPPKPSQNNISTERYYEAEDSYERLKRFLVGNVIQITGKKVNEIYKSIGPNNFIDIMSQIFTDLKNSIFYNKIPKEFTTLDISDNRYLNPECFSLLSEALEDDNNITYLDISGFNNYPDIIQYIENIIKNTKTITKLKLSIENANNKRYPDIDIYDKIANILKQNTTLTTVDLNMNKFRDGFGMSSSADICAKIIELFFDNIWKNKSITTFIISGAPKYNKVDPDFDIEKIFEEKKITLPKNRQDINGNKLKLTIYV
jgi:hypothetical protein